MKDTLQFKNFEIQETKKEDDGRLTITGYGAYFNNVDSYGDIIERGAFSKTLIERKGRIAFCYQHDIWNPIGKIEEIYEDDKGLKVVVKLSAANDDIQTKVKEGILKEMSIGYRTINSRSEVQNGIEVNLLSEIKLIEISLVTVAANPLAVVETMKSDTEKADYIKAQFDRVLTIVKNEQISFEIELLKSLVLGLPPVEKQLIKAEPHLSKDEIITALIGSKQEYLNALKINN